ncbi:amino acid ABC transporter permease [Aliamphritea hakodatensis]|uniref:amino acid ABC transporter permease n=1 Tax=Aliamphritea hakodatensis TaxID=2895352 RepID=UPI0022FD526B|nr:ABC transporter permease subunit [Aliamphritea hakodatensis]
MLNKLTASAGSNRFRLDLVLQAVFLALIFYLAYSVFHNTQVNLENRGIESGFEFLDKEAGLPIGDALISYTPTDSYGWAFFTAVVNTLYVAFFAIILATVVGVLIGIARVSRNWLVCRMAAIYVETLRNVPLLLTLIFIYVVVLSSLPSARSSWLLTEGILLNIRGFYFPKPLPQDGFGLVLFSVGLAVVLCWGFRRWAKRYTERTGQELASFRISLVLLLGLPALTYLLTGQPLLWENPELKGFNYRGGLSLRPEFLALLLGLVLYTAAFIGENVRSGIQSVSKGQVEAAQALGLKPGKVMLRVVLPQALRVIIPATTNDYTSLVKNSSLAVAIGYPDMVSVGGTIIGQNGQAIEIIGMWMAVYMAINLLISAFMNWLNARVQMVER